MIVAARIPRRILGTILRAKARIRGRREETSMNKRTIWGLIIGAALAGFTIAVIEIFGLDVYLF